MRNLYRFFIAAPSLRVGDLRALDTDTAHHLLRVLRIEANAMIRLFNGSGREYEVRVTIADRAANRVEVVCVAESKKSNLESPLPITLGAAIGKHDKLDLMCVISCGPSHLVYIICCTDLIFESELYLRVLLVICSCSCLHIILASIYLCFSSQHSKSHRVGRHRYSAADHRSNRKSSRCRQWRQRFGGRDLRSRQLRFGVVRANPAQTDALAPDRHRCVSTERPKCDSLSFAAHDAEEMVAGRQSLRSTVVAVVASDACDRLPRSEW